MNSKTPGDANDMLKTIFAMQTELNDYVFAKNNIAAAGGEKLVMDAVFSAVNSGRLKVNDLPNTWLSRYAKAMAEELKELDEELLWKWWSKDEIDIQNIRVELIDILHFLVSAMICAGLTPDRVFDIYCQKHSVNLNRQDSGYSSENKSESDNRGIS